MSPAWNAVLVAVIAFLGCATVVTVVVAITPPSPLEPCIDLRIKGWGTCEHPDHVAGPMDGKGYWLCKCPRDEESER